MIFIFIFITIFSTLLQYNVSVTTEKYVGPPPRFASDSTTSCSASIHFENCDSRTQIDYGPTGISKSVNLQLTRGMKSGTVLNIVAAVNSSAYFNIKSEEGNIILHVNTNIDSNVFFFNVNFKGIWGNKNELPEMPIKSGIKFNLLIANETNGYYIYVNGEEVNFFKHRLENPATEFLSGGSQIYSLSYKQNEPKWAVQQQRPIHALYVQVFEKGQDSPHEIHFQGCNNLSWIVLIGIINSDVSINLETSLGDVALKFNPRFADNSVMCNSEINNVWGKEEISKEMPFQKNKKFVLAIEVEKYYYKIYVNGGEFIIYKHRVPVNCVSKLKFSEGINVLKVTYHK